MGLSFWGDRPGLIGFFSLTLLMNADLPTGAVSNIIGLDISRFSQFSNWTWYPEACCFYPAQVTLD
jgi:hypothetical protein